MNTNICVHLERKVEYSDSNMWCNIGLGAFAASELDKVFSGYQPR
jgi:hypothetical protein